MKVRRHRGSSNADARGDRGYVLLVVIAVSVLVITVLGMLANLSLQRGLDAADAERALQQRWGVFSLERGLLTRASEVFQAREELVARQSPGHPPPATIRAAVTLRGVTFDILLGDEDAKLNLNSLYHRAGPDRTRQAITQLLGPAATGDTRLVPAAEPMELGRAVAAGSSNGEEPTNVPDAFRSWGEVFNLAGLETQVGSDAALPNLTTDITLWGTGQLNFRRASDEAILAVAGSVVQDGGARRLLERYRQSPTASLSVLLQTEVSNANHREALKRLLSESSTNFSVWIDASSKSSRSLRYFAAMRRNDDGVIRKIRFMH